MSQTTKLKDIISGQDNCKVFGRLIRLWDAKYVTTNTLISIDGILLDDDVCIVTNVSLIFSNKYALFTLFDISQGTMAQISVPRKLEKDFRPMLSEDQVYIFSGVTTIHSKNRSHSYHHQGFILQFTQTTKVHHLQSRGANIPHYAFNFCSFDEVPAKSLPSRPLLGGYIYTSYLSLNFLGTN